MKSTGFVVFCRIPSPLLFLEFFYGILYRCYEVILEKFLCVVGDRPFNFFDTPLFLAFFATPFFPPVFF